MNGVVVFENGEALPDGTIVSVEPVRSDSIRTTTSHDVQRLREMLLSFAGVLDDPELATDLSENLDHYLYGTPKKI